MPQANPASWKVSHAASLPNILPPYQPGGLICCWPAKQQACHQEASPASLLAGLLPSETPRAAPFASYGSAMAFGGSQAFSMSSTVFGS
jgi:hypothetical protein